MESLALLTWPPAHLVAAGLVFWAIPGAVGRAMSLAVLLLPGYGLVILLSVGAARRWLPALQGDLLQEFREHVAPQFGPRRTPLAELPLVEHLKIQPLIDLLASPDLETRKAVLEAMARRRGRRLIECIQQALKDPQPEIYQFAVAKLAQIQEMHTRELAEARALHRARPDRQNAYSLIKAYHDYLDSGLLEPALEPLYLEQLEALYRQTLEQEPEDSGGRLSLAQVLLRLRRLEAARAQCEIVLEQEEHSGEALLGLLEVSFLERDWPRFRQLAGQLNQLAPRLPPDLRERVAWLCR